MKKVPTIDLKGKEYAQVKDRVKKFRENTTNGSIETEMQQLPDGSVVIKATVVVDKSDEGSRSATGQSFGKIGTDKAFEKLETIAVGRALAFLGYLADGEIASSDEMEEFVKYQQGKKDDAIDLLKSAKSTDELKETFTKLGNLMADTEIIKVKDEMKSKLQ